MGKPSTYPPGPITLQNLEGREQVRRLVRPFTRQMSQPALMKVSEAFLKDRVIHSSFLTGLATGTLKEPGPKGLYALGLVNQAIAEEKLPDTLKHVWGSWEPMRTANGQVVGPAELFLAFVGHLDLGLTEVREIPLDQEVAVTQAFGRWVRQQLALRGIDFVVEDHQRLVEAAGSFKGLLTGKAVRGDQLLSDLPVIATELGLQEGELWDEIQALIQPA